MKQHKLTDKSNSWHSGPRQAKNRQFVAEPMLVDNNRKFLSLAKAVALLTRNVLPEPGSPSINSLARFELGSKRRLSFFNSFFLPTASMTTGVVCSLKNRAARD